MALHFAFDKRLGITGLWLGYSIACVILDLGFAFIILYPNWQKIADNIAKEREANGGVSPNSITGMSPNMMPRGGQSLVSPIAARKHV
jgi:hypothetical protein